MASKLQEHLAEVGDEVMNMPPAAPSLETIAQQPQVNLADVGDVAMNMPPAALSLETKAPQPQANLANIGDVVMNVPSAALNMVTIDLPSKGKKHWHASSGVVRSESLIFMVLSR